MRNGRLIFVYVCMVILSFSIVKIRPVSAAAPASHEYFFQIFYDPLDSDGDGKSNAIKVTMDADSTYDGTQDVRALVVLRDPFNSNCAYDSVTWSITDAKYEYAEVTLYVPSDRSEGWYDVICILYDSDNNFEDQNVKDDVAYLYPSLPNPKPYSVTIWAWDSYGWIGEAITLDGVATGYTTPHTFTGLTGSHDFTVPATDVFGIPFTDWYTGETSRTLTVNSGGTYTARYYATVATPTFSPNGGTYSSSQTVTLSCDTEGATIRYTLDGSQPRSTSTLYSNPISVSATTTIKAKAFHSDMKNSATASATYTINIPPSKVATPSFNPPAGTYTSSQSVAISCSTNGATIRYTLDGSEPTSSSVTYSSPIAVGSTTTIRAKAFKGGLTSSDTASATYTINLPVVMRDLILKVVGSGSITPGPGSHTYTNGTEVPVQATPNTDWSFDHWLLDGKVSVEMNPVPVTMGRDRNVTAVFIRVPPVAMTCDLNGVEKNNFTMNAIIYVNGLGYDQQVNASIYIVHDVAWVDGMTIPTPVSGTNTQIVSDWSGEIKPTAVWSSPLVGGEYDVCVDVNRNGEYDLGVDALVDNQIQVTAGFVVPEFSIFTLLPCLLGLSLVILFIKRKSSIMVRAPICSS